MIPYGSSPEMLQGYHMSAGDQCQVSSEIRAFSPSPDLETEAIILFLGWKLIMANI